MLPTGYNCGGLVYFGRRPYEAILDTGATRNSITAELLQMPLNEDEKDDSRGAPRLVSQVEETHPVRVCGFQRSAPSYVRNPACLRITFRGDNRQTDTRLIWFVVLPEGTANDLMLLGKPTLDALGFRSTRTQILLSLAGNASDEPLSIPAILPREPETEGEGTTLACISDEDITPPQARGTGPRSITPSLSQHCV